MLCQYEELYVAVKVFAAIGFFSFVCVTAVCLVAWFLGEEKVVNNYR